MKLSILTITARREPHYAWLTQGIAAQEQLDDEIELVIVDYFGRDAAELAPDWDRASSIHQVVVCKPKPNPWQGAYRVTRRDLAAIANARNTAVCLATHDYVAFLDDSARLGGRWLECVRRGERERESVISGAVDRGKPGGRREIDDRTRMFIGGKQGCPPYFLYGGNTCMPLAWALEVGGFEEGTDPVGHQDFVMGCMLAHCGRRIDYVPAMALLQDRRLDGRPDDKDMHPFPRANKGLPPNDKRHAIEAKFRGHVRTTELTQDIAAIRAAVQRGEPFPVHTFAASDPDWFDGSPIGDT